VFSPKNGPDPRQRVEDDRRPHEENKYQKFTNAVTGGILEIPDWPGPRILEKTRKETILLHLGYILCLVPPLFFLSKHTVITVEWLNRANVTF
jgi:hypothetical protein